LEGVGSKQHQLSPRKLRGNQEKKKNQTGCSLSRGDRDPPDNHLVYPLGRADLEVTSKGVEGDKVRKGARQVEPCTTRNGGDLVKKRYCPETGSGNP